MNKIAKSISIFFLIGVSLTSLRAQTMPYGFELSTNTPYWSTSFGSYTQYDIDEGAKQRLADWNYPLIPGSPIYRINEVVDGGGEAPTAVYYIAHVGLTEEEGYPPQWLLLWDDTRSLDDPPFTYGSIGGDTGVAWVDGIPTIGGVAAINIILENPNASNTAFTEQAIELNKGLSFTNGEWTPAQ